MAWRGSCEAPCNPDSNAVCLRRSGRLGQRTEDSSQGDVNDAAACSWGTRAYAPQHVALFCLYKEHACECRWQVRETLQSKPSATRASPQTHDNKFASSPQVAIDPSPVHRADSRAMQPSQRIKCEVPGMNLLHPTTAGASQSSRSVACRVQA